MSENSIHGGAPREERFEDHQAHPPANAWEDGRRLGGHGPADSKCDPLVRFGGGDRTQGRCRHRSGDHTARKDLPARVGRLRRSSAIQPESSPAGNRPSRSAQRACAHGDVDQGFGTRRGQVRRRQSADHHRDLLHTGSLCAAPDRRQRPVQRFLHLERVGGDAAPGEAARCGLHQEFQDQQSTVERARQGADGELDSALRRTDQPHRPHSKGPAESTISSRPEKPCAASRTAHTRDTCSPTPGCIRPWRR